jgi:hypothetical protein
LAYFFLFTKLKACLKECKFGQAEQIQGKNAKGAIPDFLKILYGMLGKLETYLEWPH